MNNNMMLEEVIKSVLEILKGYGYVSYYLVDYERNFNSLLRLAKNSNQQYYSEELATAFLNDNISQRTGEYSRLKFLSHSRCIRTLESYLNTGFVNLERYKPESKLSVSDGFLNPLDEYDSCEKASGLSESSLIKNRRPIVYLLEYMTSLGYENLSDINPGDTTAAIDEMLDEHYSPESLSTAISGMRRFYEMFPEIKKYRFEIPSRIQRERRIIDVYTDEEQERIRNYLSTAQISHRDIAISLLSFETGIRSVDICNLKKSDIDWTHDTIHIVQSKTSHPLNLPLRASYGNHMYQYLIDERPDTKEDYFFLSIHAPYKKLKTTWRIIKSVVKEAGIETNGRLTGTRMFRHNAASTMLKNGIPLSVISQELGHKSQDSTMIYLTTDKKALSSLTLPLPVGGRQ